MKVKEACEVCGKRSKKKPLLEGYRLCTKHYNIKKKEENGKTNLNRETS